MTYQHILVPIDGSEISFAAAKQAISIAKSFGSKLTAISLVAEDPFSGSDFYYSTAMLKDYIEEAYTNAEKALKKVSDIALEQGLTIETKIVKGIVSADTVIESADELKTDLIVMGSHGRKGFQKFFLGSFAQDVLGKTHTPVLIVKQ